MKEQKYLAIIELICIETKCQYYIPRKSDKTNWLCAKVQEHCHKTKYGNSHCPVPQACPHRTVMMLQKQRGSKTCCDFQCPMIKWEIK